MSLFYEFLKVRLFPPTGQECRVPILGVHMQCPIRTSFLYITMCPVPWPVKSEIPGHYDNVILSYFYILLYSTGYKKLERIKTEPRQAIYGLEHI